MPMFRSLPRQPDFLVPLLIVALAAAAGCTGAATPAGAPAAQPAPKIAVADMPKTTADGILQHIKVLSSDDFQGRAPGTAGEEKTVAYLEAEFKKLGLGPGNTDGTYIQKVPLVGITGAEAKPLTIAGAKGRTPLKWKDDYVAWTKHVADGASLDGSDMVFVGYGVSAPEYSWDDFKGVDLKGKTMVVLVNDPQIPDPSDPSKLDPKMFNGTAMTYYGRWTYKYEEAARRGAAGVFIVHEEKPAGYPYNVVQGFLGERFDLVTPDKNMGRANIEGWFSLATAQRVLKIAGQDFDALKKQALSRDFKPVALGLKASMAVRNTNRTIDSRNVLARLEGSDPALKDEYVIYSAHWDHLGVGDPDADNKNDRIHNGAIDNASGVAALLEMARTLTQVKPAPKRSILFLMVTAEEQGLLGSEYYAVTPVYPLTKTAANINLDGVNQWGRTKDVTVVGYGNSTLDDVLSAVTAQESRTIKPDPEPEKGFFYRSDHFEFAKQGVPALYTDAGTEYVGKDASYGQKKRDEYTENDYHKPSDQVKPDWDLSGAVEDLQAFFQVGYRVAQTDRWPEWKPGTEFKAKRDSVVKGDRP